MTFQVPKSNRGFDERLAEGKAFEDFVSDVLWSRGIALGLYHSRIKQWTAGESRLGAEVKYDRRAAETGNLFVETEERRDATGKSQWRASGICEDPMPWLYVIGHYHRVWIFATTTLRLVRSKFREVETKTPEGVTAKGYLLPQADGDRFAAATIGGSELTALHPWHNIPDGF